MSEWDQNDKPGWGVPERPSGSSSSDRDAPENSRDWKLIEKMMMSLQSEQRRSRRWGIFFKLLTFGYLFLLLFLLRAPVTEGLGGATTPSGPHTAMVEINGPIASDKVASADNIVSALRNAFEAESADAVMLRINSPGGSPVQSGYVNDEIERLRQKHPEKKLYAVVTDLGASGAYYIAAAADEIYANKASLVGSIGVVGGGFGFTGLMDKLGVERRLYTSGENKAFLDPFSPEKPGEVDFWQQVLDTTHQQFIEEVREGRGDRLKADEETLFSGLIWTGEQALELGLIDGLGSPGSVARDVVGAEEIVDYTYQRSPIRKLVDDLGVAVGSGLFDSVIESRLEMR